METADYAALVENLAFKHRRTEALRALMGAGALATQALRMGLRHDDPAVRVGCCRVLDHFLDEDAIPELIENLRHKEGSVRAWAMHALACDRCKEGACRPAEGEVLPIATRMLLEDRSRRVRQMAAALVGGAVHRRPDVIPALEQARDRDPHPVVRKIASWYTPGGPIYQRLAPRPTRKKRGRSLTA
jgi:HEAT repeat protein